MLFQRYLTLLIIISTSFMLAGCGTSDLERDDEYAGWSKERILRQAKSNIEGGNYKAASRDLEAIESHYPFGVDAQKAQLLSIYTYYKSGRYSLCEAQADHFIEIHPNHPKVDYAYYMKGIANFNMSLTGPVRYLPIERHKVDIGPSRESFFAFEQLIKRYPESQYANNARARMVYLKNTIAKNELEITKYYAKRKAWAAVANRAKHIVTYYDDTLSAKEALFLLSIAYDKLKLEGQANNAIKILEHNYPGSLKQYVAEFNSGKFLNY